MYKPYYQFQKERGWKRVQCWSAAGEKERHLLVFVLKGACSGESVREHSQTCSTGVSLVVFLSVQRVTQECRFGFRKTKQKTSPMLQSVYFLIIWYSVFRPNKKIEQPLHELLLLDFSLHNAMFVAWYERTRLYASPEGSWTLVQ